MAGTNEGCQQQIDDGTAMAVGHRFRHGVGKAASAHIVNEVDGVVRTQRPAAIDHFLTAALHFRVVALHGREIEVLVRSARADRGGQPEH